MATFTGTGVADTLTGAGTNDDLFGLAGNDLLIGDAGNDTLDGGLGDDTMLGGLGDDIYVVDSSGDVVVESGAEGTDLVQSSASSYTLGDNVENLTLTGSTGINGEGNNLANVMTGTSFNDTLVGNGGDDSLVGGVGQDVLRGGDGNDTYVVDNVSDQITENSGAAGGTDLVQSSVDIELLWLPAYVENVTLTGSATTAIGNGLNNVLTGNTLGNLLDGSNGLDTMVGLTGNDTYYVSESGDAVVEADGAGTDVVYAKADYTLADFVENLVLDGFSPVDGTGNSLANIIEGNGSSNRIDGGAGNDTMIGGDGSDTYVVDSNSDVVTEVFGGGTDTVETTTGVTAYTLGDFVERLTMSNTSGNSATGNSLANTITGASGNDSIDGGAGSDSMVGGVGNDTYVVDASGDRVVEIIGEGTTDEIQSSVTYTIAEGVETLRLTGTANINAIGSTASENLVGNSGNNVLNGGAGGTDSLAGGAGDDTYILTGLSGFSISDSSGTDTVVLDQNLDLSALTDIENGTLSGTGNFSLTGNTSSNVLTGNSGNNSITAVDFLSLDVDTLIGGLGADTYYVDNAADKITETGTDVDLVVAVVSYTLGSGVENLTADGPAGSMDLTGNSLANVITGNLGANKIDGGTGVDTMIGGGGNDTYVVNVAGDVVDETTDGGGVDLVEASVSYTISDANVESLTLTGTGAINATGNGSANTLTGNSGANVLDGGAGNDIMAGDAGNDTYVLDVATDTVTESADAGTDRVKIGVSYTLGNNVEQLELPGTGAANATGNSLRNLLIGNSGANVIDGGTDNDTMVGGGGDDTYYVDSASDVVTELAAGGTDTVRSTVNFSLLNKNVETLILEGTGNINGTGGNIGNSITGNSGANRIDGGLGLDTMIGGLGDDTYVVDNSSEVVTEAADEGTDTVQSTATFSLATRANVENLTLLGVSNINATGNSSANVLVGNSGNNALDGGAGADQMSGGDGNDSYTVDNAGDQVIEVSSPAGGYDVVTSSESFTLGDYVEELTLTGSATNGTGGASANKITGNGEANLLDGKAGIDTLIGGAGNDTYVVDSALDVVTDTAGTADLILSSASYTMSAGIEAMTLTGSANVNAMGNASANTIFGNAGNNLINGGAGVDSMTGGTGNDTYVIDSGTDAITEALGAGTDTVRSYVAYTLGDNIERLEILAGGAVNGTGNGLDNTMVGGAGANLLDGGVGADSMSGGSGNDTFIVDNNGDRAVELSLAGGTDVVQSSVSFTLGAYIETLTLTGSAVINGTGNALGNTITGNSAANIINGGAGVDTMSGGDGNDVYFVDNALDSVTEAAGEGTDTINSYVSYTIADVDVENLVLVGAGNFNATGNLSNNALTGNGAANTLDGGAGNDTMTGGGGNDVYIVDATLDRVVELAGGGTDTVQSSASWVLAAFVENLTLTGISDLNATGNAANNIITGNSGDNLIAAGDGADTINGGTGNDTLTGGIGSDVFVFTSSGLSNEDLITDYNVAADTIHLSKSAFAALTTSGTLDASDFLKIGSGTAAGQHIVLDGVNLLYDADGAGTGSAGVLIAHFSAAVSLTNADIVVI